MSDAPEKPKRPDIQLVRDPGGGCLLVVAVFVLFVVTLAAW